MQNILWILFYTKAQQSSRWNMTQAFRGDGGVKNSFILWMVRKCSCFLKIYYYRLCWLYSSCILVQVYTVLLLWLGGLDLCHRRFRLLLFGRRCVQRRVLHTDFWGIFVFLHTRCDASCIVTLNFFGELLYLIIVLLISRDENFLKVSQKWLDSCTWKCLYPRFCTDFVSKQKFYLFSIPVLSLQ